MSSGRSLGVEPEDRSGGRIGKFDSMLEIHEHHAERERAYQAHEGAFGRSLVVGPGRHRGYGDGSRAQLKCAHQQRAAAQTDRPRRDRPLDGGHGSKSRGAGCGLPKI